MPRYDGHAKYYKRIYGTHKRTKHLKHRTKRKGDAIRDRRGHLLGRVPVNGSGDAENEWNYTDSSVPQG